MVLRLTGTAATNAVDKTLVNNKGDFLIGSANDSLVRQAVGTNGQALFADSTTPSGVAWSSIVLNKLDSTLQSAIGNANAAILGTIVDAKGDLLVGTAADAISRLAIGTNGQVLTADSTAPTGIRWTTPAGGSRVQRVFSAEDDFGFVGDNSTDNLAAWNAMWTTLQNGDKVTFGAGVFRHSGRLVIKKPGIKLEGVGGVYWPYDTSGGALVWGTVFQPSSSGFTGNSQFYFPPSSANSGVEVNNIIIQGIVIYGNSVKASGADIDGIRMEGDVRAISVWDTTITQTSGHGIVSAASGSDKPRGGSFSHITVWSAGNLPTRVSGVVTPTGTDNTQWGINLAGFTDAKLENISVIDCRGGGFRIDAPGQLTGTHLHSVFNHGVGILITGTTGNGGLNWNTIVTDRNIKQGIVINAYGRQRILLDNLELRRDGGNEEGVTDDGGVSSNLYAALSIVGTSANPVCPVLINQLSTVVEDADGNNNYFTPVIGVELDYITEVHIDGRIWGRDTSITLGSNAADADLYLSPTITFFTGTPTSFAPNYPDIKRGRTQIVPIITSSATWSAMPVTESQFGGTSSRQREIGYDLRRQNWARIGVQLSTNGATNAVLYVQASSDNGSNWTTVTNQIGIGSGQGNYKQSAWMLVPDAMKTDVLLRVTGILGDGTISPAVLSVTAQTRP